MRTAIAAAGLIFITTTVHADVIYPDAITFEPAYAIGPPAGIPWTIRPEDVGSPLFVFGIIPGVAAPFTDLVPAGIHELTYVVEGAACTGWGNWDDIPCSGGTNVTFGGGTLSIYLDLTPDADFANTDSFRDGERVLQAAIQLIDVTDDDPYETCPMVEDRPDVRMYFTFTGGSWFERVASRGVGLSAIALGELPGHHPDMVPEPLRALGYVLRIDGSIDIFGPVATQQTTWGRVKAMYR